jgi:predicted RNA-binding Zn-ribbon protein involved in translation (DUF1610 family)
MSASDETVTSLEAAASAGAAAPQGGPPRETVAPAGACGLWCGACFVYIASRDDPESLAWFASRMGQTVDEARCEGCRSRKLSKYCETCDLIVCARQRGHEFCGECSDFPCPKLVAFGEERPHRIEILPDLKRIADIGGDAWIEEVAVRYTCPDCGTVNSAYHLKCRHCGHEPGSPYAGDHFEEIRARLAPAAD